MKKYIMKISFVNQSISYHILLACDVDIFKKFSADYTEEN
jgi:hypothetical protein